MSKLVLVCLRNSSLSQRAATHRQLTGFLEELRPDNLEAAPAVIAEDGSGVLLGLFNPTGADTLHGCNAYSGWLARPRECWWRMGTPAPEGTFALARSDEHCIELLADYVGSRTLWFTQTDTLFIASMSQRAIVRFLGSFEPNPSALAWMLSSGCIGPGESWDRRIHSLRPGAMLRLQRKTWRMTVHEPPVELTPASREALPEAVHHTHLREALDETVGGLKFDWSRWVLPLSGGHDSRTLLLWLRRNEHLRCVTWGTARALEIKGSDACVAREVAARLGVTHQYFELEADEAPQRVLERFLLAGEGRVDHISGYMDGFDLWSRLARAGVTGMVRGDQPFGHSAVRDQGEARFRVGLTLWADYENLPAAAALGLGHLGQRLPAALAPRAGEAPEDFRDRLHHVFRTPTVYGALNEIKCAYMETASPLFLPAIVRLARSHPAPLRTAKALFKRVAAERKLPVRIADDIAIESPEAISSRPAFTELILDEIASAHTRELLSTDLVAFIARGMTRRAAKPSWRKSPLAQHAKQFLPSWIRKAVAPRFDGRTLAAARLGLRTYLIAKMTQRLALDARDGGRALLSRAS